MGCGPATEAEMDSRGIMLVGIVAAVASVGCRAATRVIQEPRADFEVAEGEGNRGYLVGTPPPLSEERKSTRQMVEAELEIPTRYQPSTKRAAVMVGQADTSEETWQPEGASLEGVPISYDTYVVKPGDTLSSISARPDVYGSGSKWRKLYNANRDRITDPNRVPAGMTLRVPRDEGSGAGPFAEQESGGEQPIKFVK